MRERAHRVAAYVAPVSFGLGDLVVSLPAVQALIDAVGDETWLVARSPVQAALAERIDGLAGCVADGCVRPRRSTVGSWTCATIRCSVTTGGAQRRSSRRSGDSRINDILGRICADFGIVADFTRPVAADVAHPDPSCGSSVLLVIDTDGPTKRWPADLLARAGLAARTPGRRRARRRP